MKIVLIFCEICENKLKIFYRKKVQVYSCRSNKNGYIYTVIINTTQSWKQNAI